MAIAMRNAPKEHSEQQLLAIVDPFPHDRAARDEVLRSEHGQTFAEYGLILALVVVVAVAGLSPFGTGLATYIADTFNAVTTML